MCIVCKSIRFFLLHPGDHLTIDVNPDDPETALHVILNKSGSDREKEAGGVEVEESRISAPTSGDFGRPHSVADTESDGGNISSSSSGSSSGSAQDSGDRPSLHRQV